ncbi:MAG: TetR/AcrR family transcriptional regulator [Nocardioidaceae bacterium]
MPDRPTEGLREHPQSPRSIRVHEAAVAAARALLHEGGLPAATTDAIAERSGVSKATLYRHWPSRVAIAAEAFGREAAEAVPPPDTGSALGDLTEQLRLTGRFYGGHQGIVFSQLLAAGVTDPGGAAYLRAWFLAGRRRDVAGLWQRWVERGEVRADVDVETAVDLLLAPLVLRVLLGHRPLDDADDAAAELAGLALQGLACRQSHRPPNEPGVT